MKLDNKIKINSRLFSLLLFLIIYASILTTVMNQLIVPISKDMNSYYIRIFFDNEKKKPEFVKINMALDFTFIPLSQNYTLKEDNTEAKIYYDKEIVEIDNKEYDTKLITLYNFYFEEQNNINIKNLKFYYINKKDMNKDDINKNNKIYNNLYYGQLGLSPIYDDNYLNLLYILKEQKIIEQMSFGFSFGKNKNNFLYFGNIDKNKNNIFKGKDYSQLINLDKKLLKKYNKWGTKIEALVIEKKNDLVKHSQHKYFAYFNVIEDRIFVPDKIMEYLITRIFNTYIKNGICFITEYSDKKFINCKKNRLMDEKDNFPAIIFVIKKYGFKLTFEDLFIDSIKEDELIFIIQKNYYDIDTSIILFGSRFFKKYIIEFNLEESNIIFHSDKILPIINLEQIEDDFWRDMIRDYNKEIEHYDSNYGNDKDDKNEEGDEEKKNEVINENKSDKNNIIENNDGDIDNKNKDKKIKIEFGYDFLYKIFFIFLFIIAFFVGICIFFHFRKKIRIEKEKKYFNQPLNDEKNIKE